MLDRLAEVVGAIDSARRRGKPVSWSTSGVIKGPARPGASPPLVTSSLSGPTGESLEIPPHSDPSPGLSAVRSTMNGAGSAVIGLSAVNTAPKSVNGTLADNDRDMLNCRSSGSRLSLEGFPEGKKELVVMFRSPSSSEFTRLVVLEA
jgi:hypothetical protein